jgi:hypothetical protein
MQLEFHQLDPPCEHLRVRHPQRQRRPLLNPVPSWAVTCMRVAARVWQYCGETGSRRWMAMVLRPGHCGSPASICLSMRKSKVAKLP